MLRALHILPVCILVCFAPKTSLGVSEGIFTINDNGVRGKGDYTIINGVVKIGLELVIGETSDHPNDIGTAVITSHPSINRLNASPSSNDGPITSLPENSRPIASLPANSRPIASLPANRGPSTSFPLNSGASTSLPANKMPIVPLPPEGEAVNPARVVLTAEDNQFIDEMVAAHNELRSVHFSPPLQNNTQMSLSAKRYALVLASKQDLEHSPLTKRQGIGENLAMGCTTAGGRITAKEAIKKWYEEACRHNFSIHAFQNKSGHFSQLVWKATEEIGVGRAFGKKWGMNCSFIVTRYRPKGNVDSEAAFKENVETGTFDPVSYNCSALNSGIKVAREESRVKDTTPGNQQQDNRIQEKYFNNAESSLGNKASSRYSNMQKYRDMYFKNSRGLNGGNLLGVREVNTGRVRGYNSKPMVSRLRSEGYQADNGGNLPQFATERMNEYVTRPRSFRAHVPHRPKPDNKIVWIIP